MSSNISNTEKKNKSKKSDHISKHQKYQKYQKQDKSTQDKSTHDVKYQPDDETIQMQIKRVIACKKNKINFISGTVTPCQSNKYKKGEFVAEDIESILIGFRYLYEMYGRNFVQYLDGMFAFCLIDMRSKFPKIKFVAIL